MSSPLFASTEMKIMRAGYHTECLKFEFAQFLARKTYEIRQESNVETNRKAAVYRELVPLPNHWPVILGEIMYNLRAALDHMIYDLTLAKNGEPLDGTEFPIFENETRYFGTETGGGLYKIRGIDDRAKAVIQPLQPFESRKSAGPNTENILAILHELNIIDKHRTIHIVRRSMKRFGLRVVRTVAAPFDQNIPMGDWEDGAILAEWSPDGPLNDEVDVEIQVEFDIAFGNGNYKAALAGMKVITVCEKLLEIVNGIRITFLNAVAEPAGG